MNIETFIDTIEESYLDDALEKLAKSPKDLILIYINALEFRRAKLMRGNVIPEGDDKERDITITYVDANSSKSDLS